MKDIPLIAIDALGIDQPGGARTAILDLFNTLFKIRSRWRYLVFLSRSEPLLTSFPNVRQIVLPVRKGLLARVLIQILMPYMVLRHNVDLVHFTKSQGGLVWGAKVVLTIFDVTTLRHPELHSPQAVWVWRCLQPIVSRHADAVVALSNNAAHDIHQILHVPEEKIAIVPCAAQSSCSAQLAGDSIVRIKARYDLPERYMLFVGILARKKNLLTLLRALSILQERGIGFPPLILVGPRYRFSDASEEILELVEELGLGQRVRYIGPVASNELAPFYSAADIFLMPSIHEGFGIPCLEAMKCGTPVIASRASALPEVVGEAGLLVDDYMSPVAWAAQIARLLSDAELRADLAEKGESRAQRFTWERSAQMLAALYERLLDIPHLGGISGFA